MVLASQNASSDRATLQKYSSVAYDAIVIGAGHNGLVAANYLASSNLKVLVVEAREQIGGMTSSGFTIPEAPNHLINHCAVDPILWSPGPAARDLRLEQYGLEMIEVDPPFAYLHPDGASIAFWRDPARTAAEIRKFSSTDATAFLEFAHFLNSFFDVLYPLMAANPSRPALSAITKIGGAAFRHRGQLSEIIQFILASGKEVIEERFEHPIVRAAMHVACGATMSSSLPGSTVQFALLAAVHRFACLRPVGGTQAIPNALAARLRSLGGEILTGAGVKQILVEKRRATGIVLENGREIRAKSAVLTSCDPKQTLLRTVALRDASEFDRGEISRDSSKRLRVRTNEDRHRVLFEN